MFLKYLKTISVLLLLFLFQSKYFSQIKVITTLPSLYSITKNLGGDLIKVSSITKGSQDAHYIEAKPSYMVDLSKADLLIYSGLELEIGWLPLLIQGARNSDVSAGAKGNLNASTALSEEQILEKVRGEVDRSMGDVHPMGNPHYLLDPNIAMDVAELITDKLIELDSKNRSSYQNKLKSFQDKLYNKIKEWDEKLKSIKGKEVVCYHPHWSYLLNWMKIKSAGYIELKPGIPPTPKHKRSIIELMKNRNIKVIIISSWKEPTKAKEIAEEVGAELVIFPGEVGAISGTDDYFKWIDFMVNKITDAFKNK